MDGKSPISCLQEIAAAKRTALPVYRESGSGPFRCDVYVNGISAVGFGSTKKAAKHESAKNALEKMGYGTSTPVCIQESPRRSSLDFTNYVGELNEHASKSGCKYPEYKFIDTSINAEFIFHCEFLSYQVEGRGFNKKEAKQDAAKNMMNLIKQQPTKEVDKKYLLHKNIDVEIQNQNAVVKVFNTLSIVSRSLPQQTTKILEPSPEIKLEYGEIESMKKQLAGFGVKYTLTQFQRKPCIMKLVINDTSFTLMSIGDTQEEATRKILYDALLLKKTGCTMDDSIFGFN